MQQHKIVSQVEWIEARKAHLAREKELTRKLDRLREERRALPWVKVEKDYIFDGPDGKVSLAALFQGRSQLVVQHFSSARAGRKVASAAPLRPTTSTPRASTLSRRTSAS